MSYENGALWNAFRELLISEMERIRDDIKGVSSDIKSLDSELKELRSFTNREITDLKVRVVAIEVKITMIALLAGSLGSAGFEILKYLVMNK